MSAEQKHTKGKPKKKAALCAVIGTEAAFWVEILANFKFNVCFLDALSAPGVFLCVDRAEITPSAAK